jgi:hypothetical protein
MMDVFLEQDEEEDLEYTGIIEITEPLINQNAGFRPLPIICHICDEIYNQDGYFR